MKVGVPLSSREVRESGHDEVARHVLVASACASAHDHEAFFGDEAQSPLDRRVLGRLNGGALFSVACRPQHANRLGGGHRTIEAGPVALASAAYQRSSAAGVNAGAEVAERGGLNPHPVPNDALPG